MNCQHACRSFNTAPEIALKKVSETLEASDYYNENLMLESSGHLFQPIWDSRTKLKSYSVLCEPHARIIVARVSDASLPATE